MWRNAAELGDEQHLKLDERLQPGLDVRRSVSILRLSD
jgi:hypothetical protein